MIHTITPTEIVVLSVLLTALLVLVIGGLLAAAGNADRQIENFSGGTACEPGISRDSSCGVERGSKTESAELSCAWCQKEQAIKSHPDESHGICARHKAILIADARRFPKSQYA